MRFLLFLACAASCWGACAGNYVESGDMCTASVGATSKNYSTIADALAAIPADLVSDGHSYTVAIYKDGPGTDGEYTCTGGTSCFTIADHTTSSTRYIHITAATGQSFMDDANVRTNPLKYDASKGVAIRKTDNFGSLFLLDDPGGYIRITRLQLSKSATGSGGILINDGGAATTPNALYADVIAESAASSGNMIQVGGTSNVVRNVIAIATTTGAVSGIYIKGGATVIGCGVIRPSDLTAAGTGFIRNSGTAILKSSYSFGFSAASSGTFDAASGYNATDQSSIAGSTGNVTSLAMTDAGFAGTLAASRDFRVTSETSIVGAGALDATNAQYDISNAYRPEAPTIGPWEDAPGTPPAAPLTKRRILQ